ncbi:hypothetical protein BFP70_00500 [Thioclava sp. SK-1]|uniref:SRPBCC family protein n=1 Tax=Thioclava sp. SK-1 TaxID=1889770 RepID=UPI0008265DA4|nr:SRPBCC family protein [Thioclava sp. SK-1]OCX66678.1 hypothetical protein BFP70_00500 [Thioclava sp. SK-1]
MKFSTREDITAPIDFVYDQLTDFTAFEQAGRDRGIDFRRTDDLTVAGLGMGWDVDFHFRGKARQISMKVTRFERPDALEFTGQSSSFDLSIAVLLTALSSARTRVQVGIDVRPRTLGARLMLQSAKLGRASLDRKFDRRIAAYAREIEARHLTALS